jgi:hypothetical protein
MLFGSYFFLIDFFFLIKKDKYLNFFSHPAIVLIFWKTLDADPDLTPDPPFLFFFYQKK